MAVQTVPIALSGELPLSTQEKIQRSDATACINRTDKRTLCDTHVNIGIFFDGTNNNRERDSPQQGHTNIAVLSKAYRDEPKNGYFSFYVPGVGTRFPEIGEAGELASGKSQGAGGDSRINWALIQLLDAMYRTVLGDSAPQFDGDKTRTACTTGPLHASVITANLMGKKSYFTSSGLLMQLEAALKSKPPKKLTLVNLSVFGFSRGAAQARAFCYFLQHILLRTADGGITYTLAGVPFRLQFLGLFDTVASAGLADSSPMWRGLGGWANGTQEIVPCVERTVHLCAAHEIRINFPLSTTRIGDSPRYPANAVEKVYPGSHSDVGGGYAPRDQGKSTRGRASLLSQMPLIDMYNEARASTVPLLSRDELLTLTGGKKVVADLEINPECIKLFNAYREWAAPAATGKQIEGVLHLHMQFYWRWRIKHAGKLAALKSYGLAGRQDQIDILESDSDFSSDWLKAAKLKLLRKMNSPGAAFSTLAQDEFLAVLESFKGKERCSVPVLIERFFDEMVHDSHASFCLVGPTSKADRKDKIAQIFRELDDNCRGLGEGLDDAPGHVSHLTRDDVRWTLSEGVERRIYDFQKGVPEKDQKNYPLLTDADREQLLAMEDMSTSLVVRLINRSTRRELGGHVRYRRVFDLSGGADSASDLHDLVHLPNPAEKAEKAKEAENARKEWHERQPNGSARTTNQFANTR